MRGFCWLTTLLGVMVSGLASAACEQPYTTDSLLGDMMTVEEGLLSGNDAAAGASAAALAAGFPCLNEVLPMMIVSRSYRAVAAGLYVGGQQELGKQWFATALDIDPTYEYGLQDLNAEHPVRRVYSDARGADRPPKAAASGTLIEGSHYLDGRPLNTAEATPSGPHLYQLKTDTVRSWVITGNAFPAEALVAVVAAVAAAESRRCC